MTLLISLRISEGQGVKVPKDQKLVCRKGQLRNHEATPAPRIPHTVDREAVHVHVQTTGADVDERNKVFGADFEEEECAVTVSAKPGRILFNEIDDLFLRETESIEIFAECPEDLSKGAVFDHLVDLHISLGCW